MTDKEALAAKAVVDSHGLYRYCDRECDDCRLVNDHPVCFNCNEKDKDDIPTMYFLHEDGSCIRE